MPTKPKATAGRKTTDKKATQASRRNAGRNAQKTAEKTPSTAIDFCGLKLTALRRDFIIHYCTPGQPCFHNAFQAALKAGYKKNVASSEIYRTLREPGIQKIIKANEQIAHMAIHSAAMRALEIKQRRAFFDPMDYFEKKTLTRQTKDGGEYTVEVLGLKDLEDMTEEQRMCIDGVDIKGQSSTPVYLMPDRGKELNDILRVDSELRKSLADTDEEETREIIVERITIRETRRAQRPSELQREIIEDPVEAEEGEEEEGDE